MVSTRSTSVAMNSVSASPPEKAAPARRNGAATAMKSPTAPWSHAPSKTTLIWFAISLPLVLWDTGYVLLRPHSMPGGSLHWPWTPYGLYGTVDHMYGFKQWEAGNGFTAAQGWLNAVETAMYFAYLWLWSQNNAAMGVKTAVTGRAGAVMALVGFSAAVMTVSKTVLYWLNEAFSGFDNIGHNPWGDLVLMWIIPNGAWLVFPSIMIYEIGSDILDGLTAASDPALKSE